MGVSPFLGWPIAWLPAESGRSPVFSEQGETDCVQERELLWELEGGHEIVQIEAPNKCQKKKKYP